MKPHPRVSVRPARQKEIEIEIYESEVVDEMCKTVIFFILPLASVIANSDLANPSDADKMVRRERSRTKRREYGEIGVYE